MPNKVKGTIVGIDGNAYSLMGHFRNLAIDQGFDEGWVDSILNEAMSGDYNNLIYTLDSNMEGE